MDIQVEANIRFCCPRNNRTWFYRNRVAQHLFNWSSRKQTSVHISHWNWSKMKSHNYKGAGELINKLATIITWTSLHNWVYPTQLRTVDLVSNPTHKNIWKNEHITLMLHLLNLTRPCCKSSRQQIININSLKIFNPMWIHTQLSSLWRNEWDTKIFWTFLVNTFFPSL
jgi:hypothetical protein